MRPSPDADLVIAGAGCAGLSALWHVLQHLPAADRRRVVVVDRDPTPADDRTWGFWGPASAPFTDVADRRWEQLLVRFPGWQVTSRLDGRSYWRVRRQAYDTTILEAAASRSEVEVVAADIVELRDEPGGAVVVTSEGELRAPTVFQNVMVAPDDRHGVVHHPLRQHFGGWEVETSSPVFDPGVVTFMDFDTDQHDGVAFFYVLPDAPDRALVEHTLFSPTPADRSFYDDHLLEHLEAIGAGDIRITRREYGAIPMEDRTLHQRWGDHIWNLGGVGGMTKPSTGYTFQRIHAQTRQLVTSWAAGATRPLPRAPWRFALADRLLLHVLHHQPERGRPVFERLFRTTPLDQLLSFLDEETSWRDDLALMADQRRLPFLRALASEAGHELTRRLSR